MLPLLAALAAAPGVGTKEGDSIAWTVSSVSGTDNTGAPWVASAGFTIQNNGKLELYNSGDGSPPTDPPDEWVIGYPDATYAADYECQVQEDSQTGGGTRNGAVGATWIDCSTADSNRDWSIDMGGSGDATWTLGVKIRHKTSLIIYVDIAIILSVFDGFS